jgi:hypothetical protein
VKLIWIGTCGTIAMALVTTFSELMYRRWRKPQPHFAFNKILNYDRAITSQEFNAMIANG